VAISNHRLISFADGQVTFRRRDSAHHNEQKLTALSHDKFLRRFLLHILPQGFVRIRHFSWPADGVARHCRHASSCWVRHKNRLSKNTLLPPKTFPIFIAAPSVENQ
jgi:Putative transposase